MFCCGGLLLVCFWRKFRERERGRETREMKKKVLFFIEGSGLCTKSKEEADADDFDADWIAEGDFF